VHGDCFLLRERAGGGTINVAALWEPQDILDPKTKAPVADRKPDVAAPEAVTLTGDWQRVAGDGEGGRALPRARGAHGAELGRRQAMTVLCDGFQFEEGYYHNDYHRMPTTWSPAGSTTRPPM